MPKWTKQQQDAILAKEKNILVSAAAGSGKTAVLTERIVTELTDSENPVSAGSLLVVTFTNAAAAEMRERIIAKLTDKMEADPDNELIRHQLTLIGNASITTIHSFCLNMIRENFIQAGVDPAFKIADTTENNLLKLEAITEVSDEMYEDSDFSDAFIKLSESYSGVKNMDSLTELASDIYNFVMSLPEPVKWLDSSAKAFDLETDFDDTEIAKIIIENTKNTLELILSQYNTIIEKAENDDVPEVLSLLKEERSQFLEASKWDNYSQLYEFFKKLKFKSFPREKKGFEPFFREYIKQVRDGIKDTVNKKLCEKFFNLSSKEQALAQKELYPQVLALSEFVKRIIVRFDEKKAKRNILNFNDLEHICYRLFVDESGERTELAKKTSERFSEILIDEYQDTSRLQESIFSAIHEENRMFMVGDIKQSIYRFRNTDPMLFRDKSDSFKALEGAENRKILLSKNFRSRGSVLSAINYFFLRLMSRNAGEICYDKEEMLYEGAEFGESINPLPLETEINIIDRALEINEEDDEEADIIHELTSSELEAEFLADKIEELILSGYEVNDKGKMRKISYRDICILMRSTNAQAPIFAEILSERGIPAFSDTESVFFESGEIDTIMSFLKIIDNPNQDIPLLAVLRSPIYNFTTNELAEIRMAKMRGDFYVALTEKSISNDALGARICSFLKELESLRLSAKVLSTHELIWEIYVKSGFYDYIGATKNGKLKQANLRNFYVRAADYDKAGFKGLYSFISFMEEFKSSGSDFASAKLISEEQDVVRIMSIHKSKGLEFPVVILASCDKKFNMQDINKPLLFHHKFGYGPKFVDSALRVTYPTAAKSAISSVILNETLSEEMRILYVALTRAKEKLIISACTKNLSKAAYRWRLGENGKFKIDEKRVLSAKSYLDWMGMCLINHPDASALTCDIAENLKIFEDDSRFKINILPPKIRMSAKTVESKSEEENDVDTSRIIDLVNAKYSREEFLGIPSKITVTELKRKIAEEDEETVYLYKNKPSKIKSRVSAAARGTAFHTVMEHIDFAGDVSENGIKKVAKELKIKGFLSEDELNSLDINKISLFFKSEMFKKIRKAKEVHREVMFAIKEKAKKLGIANSDAEILVQGIIDLVLVYDDEIIILDYKTDRGISPKDAIKKYRVQLICYSMATEKLYKKEAKKAYIYLFENDEFAEIKLDGNFLSDRFDETM